MSAPAADWGGGYVTRIAYLPGYYRQQSPLHLNLACLLGGVAGIEAGAATRLAYVELGCGQGLGALMLAACNPLWQVTGIDFNPAHIATARELAGAADIANARFIEADIANLAESSVWDEIPPADAVTLHGLWSWVGDPVRAGIIGLLRRKLRPGGIAYVSYNALPGWQGALGLQRVLLEAGRRTPGHALRQVAAGWDLVRALAEADSPHLAESGVARALIADSTRSPPAYLAHEYLNAAWRPCFHADVTAALAPAKLDWVASAQLIENFTPLLLSDPARAVAASHGDDPVMRELIKDMFLARPLRQDVFVRGARPLSGAERDRALGETMLALTCAPEHFVWEFEAPAGQARFERRFFAPIVEALARSPQTVKSLLELPGLPRRDNPGEVVGMLVGSHQALPISGPPGAPEPRALKLNREVARRLFRSDILDLGVAFATSGTGAPLPCTMLDLFIADRLRRDPAADAAAWARDLGADQPPSEQERLRGFIERTLAERAPVWRRFGAIG